MVIRLADMSPRRRTLMIVIGVGALVGMVFGAIGVAEFVADRQYRGTWCGDDDRVRKVDGSGECVGYTDGSYRFMPGADPALDRIQQLIADENAEALGRAHVNVAVMLPMPWQGQGSTSLTSIRHQLEGAYAAQRAANQEDEVKYRLLVTNIGYEGRGWQQVGAQLVALRRADQVALATGLGPSLVNTGNLMRQLSDAGIPMVASIATADDLHGGSTGIRHLRRVTPSNQDEVTAMLAFMRQRPEQVVGAAAVPNESNTLLVAASRVNDQDTYTQWLIAKFKEGIGERVGRRFFEPDNLGEGAAIGAIAAQVCADDDIAVVYFAGRSDPLRRLVTELGRSCPLGRTITVMSGDDASELATPRSDAEFFAALQGPRPKVELLYSGLAHPGQWAGLPTDSGSPRALDRLRGTLDQAGLDTDLSDGVAMMSHDAVAVAVAAAGRVATALPDGKVGHLQLGDLANGFAQIVPADPVCGASGPIGIVYGEAQDGVAEGNAVNKPIPIIQIRPDGSTVVAGGRPVFPMGQSFWEGRCGMPR